jgi:hypothetical protein
MSNIKRGYEALESTDGLTATTLHQQVQETQEAYFDLERELETSKGIVQEVIELYEEGEDLAVVMARLKEFLDEEEL